MNTYFRRMKARVDSFLHPTDKMSAGSTPKNMRSELGQVADDDYDATEDALDERDLDSETGSHLRTPGGVGAMMNKSAYDVFHVDKPILAMLHLWGMDESIVHELAKREIEQYYTNGVDAILVEDYFGSPKDVEWALDYLSTNYRDQVYGVNLLGDPERAFVIADQYKASFLQIDSICGHLPQGRNMRGHDVDDLYAKSCDGDFAERLGELRALHPLIFLLGGVRFKYQPVLSGRSVKEDLALGKERCDCVVVTGTGTGVDTGIKKIQQFRVELGDFPLFVGAGMTADTCQQQLALADGAIVGSWFKENGATGSPVDPVRVRQFMEKVKDVRARTAK